MQTTVDGFRAYLKRGLAAVIFLILLIGGSGLALSVVAFGVSALSHVGVGQGAVPTAQAAPSQRGKASTSKPKTPTDNVTVLGAPEDPLSKGSETSVTDQLNYQLDHMHSPIGDALNNGGVAVGDQLQAGFGHFLSGLLETLFVEEDNTSAAGH